MVVNLIVFLAIYLQYVFSAHLQKETTNTNVCQTEGCSTSAKTILKWLDPNVDPCSDFYEFVCGNWRNIPENERERISRGSRGSIIEYYLPNLLKNSSVQDSYLFGKLREFIITCASPDENSSGIAPALALFKKAGGWPAFDPDWSNDTWNFFDAELALGGVLLPLDVLLVGDETKNASFLQIGMPKRFFDLPMEGMPKDVLNFIKVTMMQLFFGTLKMYGFDDEHAYNTSSEIVDFEIELSKELSKTPGEIGVYRFNELQNNLKWINWAKLIENYAPKDFELKPDTTILAWRQNYIKVLERFIKQYPSKTIANYMIGKVAVEVSSFLQKPHDLYGCVSLIRQNSLAPILKTYLARAVKDDSRAAEKMTQVIKAELFKEIHDNEWLDEITRHEVAKNISELKTKVGFPEAFVDLERLESFYNGFEMDTSSYFESLMYEQKWDLRNKFYTLGKESHKPTVEDIYMNDEYNLYDTALYVISENELIVTSNFLHSLPLFSSQNPAYVNYGHAGHVIAHEFIHVLDNKANPFNVEEGEEEEPFGKYTLERWGSNETDDIYNQKKQCFIDLYSSFTDTKNTGLKLNGTQTQGEDLADNGGLKLSLYAYRMLAKQLDSPEQKLPQLEQYSVEQLFMISVANTFCAVPDKAELLEQLADDNHSLKEFRVNGMMMNSPEFSEIFNCPDGAPMNPEKKCEVWF